MVSCSVCAEALSEGHRFCPSCGQPADVSDTPTNTAPRPPTPRTPAARSGPARTSAVGARFPTGTILAGRYRIVDLLGRGGMGEVYRAEDLTLAQVVALKFLPEALRDDPERRERFLGEVRIARQVSHPAVCRVYGVDEVEGQLCLSMEYVDGEDLATLLRRIGRLPEDKALVIARQVCAGLAAVHDKGVLHRDLKPENVMIDGEGKARLADFGLAGLAKGLQGTEARSGTPAYMSPEQLAGREVTVRSDVYALGLVLFELFTGRRAFEGRTYAELARQHREEPPPRPSERVEHLDPSIERAVLRCLEKDPRRRPASALAVAAALPGGDPLAAALAAGDTPSPELVAAAGEGEEGLKPELALMMLVAALAALAIIPLLSRSRQLFRIVPFEKTPAVFEDKARELLARMGAAPPLDSATGFMVDEDYGEWIRNNDSSPQRWKRLALGQPPIVMFWYRQSPRPLASTDDLGKVDYANPPASLSGMAGVQLDTEGRLHGFYVVPPQQEASSGPAAAPDWSPVFAEARLDPARFQPATPEWAPPFFCDTRAAWTGVYPERPDLPIRLEAAAHRGQPVFFRVVAPWSRPERSQPLFRSARERAGIALICLMALAVGGVAVFLARRHLREGRGDRAGAARLAVYTFGTGLASWAIVADHVSELEGEMVLFLRGCGLVLFVTAVIWTLYLALEPYVRRRWPHALISWARLLSGRVRDPLVGRDVLIGIVGGSLFALLTDIAQLIPEWKGAPGFPPRAFGLDMFVRPRLVVASLLFDQLNSAAIAMAMLLIILVLRLLLRRQWLAIAATLALIALPDALILGISPWIAIPVEMLLIGIPALILVRFGLLSAIVTLYVGHRLQLMPLTDDFAHWTAGPTLVLLLLLAAVAVYGFRQSVGRRPLFKGLLAGD
jgi:predicted Ser/Thr protein kinase